MNNEPLTTTPHAWRRLARKIDPHSTRYAVRELAGGVSAHTAALTLTLADGKERTVVVRRPGARALAANPRAAEDEYRILQSVHAAGIKSPAPLLLDLSGEIFPAPYLVMEHVAGAPEYAPANPVALGVRIAAELAKLHTMPLTGDLAFLPRQAQRMAQRFTTLPAELDHSLDEGHIRALIAPVWPRLLAEGGALLHGDFWPGNLLWRNGDLAAIVDWEDAEIGNPLSDFAITRLDMLWIFGVEAMTAFTEQYQALTRFDFATLPYWELVAALRPGLQLDEWAATWPALGRPDITAATMRAGQHWFVTQALARL